MFTETTHEPSDDPCKPSPQTQVVSLEEQL